jgi:hypothetical protein
LARSRLIRSFNCAAGSIPFHCRNTIASCFWAASLCLSGRPQPQWWIHYVLWFITCLFVFILSWLFFTCWLNCSFFRSCGTFHRFKACVSSPLGFRNHYTGWQLQVIT